MPSFSKNIWALGWVSFFTDLATAMIKPLIPIYVVLVLNQGVDKLGYVLAITTLVSYLFRWFGGWLSDTLQVTKPLLLIGYGLSTIMKPLFSLAESWGSVAAISAAERFGKAIRSAPKDVLISASAQPQQQGRAFGLHKTLDIAGEMLGGILAFLLLTWLGQSEYWIRTIFELSLLPGLIGLFILIFWVKDLVKQQPKTIAAETSNGQMDSSLRGWFTVYFLAVFFMLSDAFMVIRGSEIGIATQWLPLLMVSSALTQTLISYRAGKRLDATGQFNGARFLMQISLWAGLISTGLLLLQSPVSLVLAFVFQGVFMVTGLNAMRSRIGQTEHKKGRAYGIFYLGTALATALGSLIIGQIWEHFGAIWALEFSAAGLVAVLFTISLFKSILPLYSPDR